MKDDVYCGYCKYYLEGNCQKNNTKVKEDRLSDCQLFEPVAIGVMVQIQREKVWEG